MLAAVAAALIALQPPHPAAASPSTPTVSAPAAVRRGPVILLSLDGFRPDYLHRGVTPELNRLARGGVLAPEGMRPSFPTLTFPNHYTLVTGLRPDHHGVVANQMDDPAVTGDTHFTYTQQAPVADRRWWDGGEPLWVTARKAGLKTATEFWPGSEADIGGVRPDRWAHFDAAISFEHRVDAVLDWLALPPADRPAFVTLYFDEPDHTGHRKGPDSPELKAALARVDGAVGRLARGLRRLGLYDVTDLVIVSDHGMTPTARARVAFVDDWTDVAAVHQVVGGPVGEYAFQGPGAAAAEAALIGPHPHVDCRRKADLPPELGYGRHPRVPAVVCVSEPGWEVTTRAAYARLKDFSVGEHGYPPSLRDMRALFLAHGPAFRPGYRQPVFDNVDVQPLLARLLGVEAPRGDGALAPVAGMLR